MTDPSYNVVIRKVLKLEVQTFPEFASGSQIYTDGSASKHDQKVVSAGWGFVFFREGAVPDDSDSRFAVAQGPVAISSDGHYFLGARRRINKTGELYALLGCSFFICGQIDASDPFLVLGSTVFIHTDSKYCQGVAEFEFHPQENVAMSTLLPHLIKSS